MSPAHQITMLKFIKNLSMLSTTLDALHSSNAIELLIDLLSYSMKKNQPHFREICNQVLNTMFNLCRLSKIRQEDAAVNGIIPLLKRIMDTKRPPKEFALPILCDMAHSGKVGRKYLWQNQGLQFYISLLADQYWQVTALDAIFIWYINSSSCTCELANSGCRLQEETARVEKCLLDGTFTEAIVACFNTPKANSFDVNLLEPLQKLLRLSPPVSASLARADMFTGILQKLNHKKAVVRLNLLRVVRSISDPHEERTLSIRNHDLFEAIESLAESDSAVLVRNMASELVKSTLEQANENGRAVRSRQSLIRTSSYTPPTLQSSVSNPMTPTHGSRISQSSAFIDGSITPRRTNTDLGDILYRPRSRDGPGSLAGRRSSVMDISNTSSASRSRLPRTSLRPSKSSMAAPTIRDEPSSTKKESGVRAAKVETKSNASPIPSSVSHLNSKRRPRQPSNGDLTSTGR